MILKDGGVLIIPEKTISKWKELHPNLEIEKIISQMDFSKCTYKGALKLINKTLKDKTTEVKK